MTTKSNLAHLHQTASIDDAIARYATLTNGQKCDERDRLLTLVISRLLDLGVIAPIDIVHGACAIGGIAGTGDHAIDVFQKIGSLQFLLGVAIESGDAPDQTLLDVTLLAGQLAYQAQLALAGSLER